MSDTTSGKVRMGIVDTLYEFIDRYYADALAEAVRTGQPWLQIDHGDLFQYDADLARDALENPDTIRLNLNEAIDQYDLPIDTDHTPQAHLIGLPEDHVYYPSDLDADIEGQYVGVRGKLEQATKPEEIATTVAFRCRECERISYVDQHGDPDEINEPTGCHHEGCSGHAFDIVPAETTRENFTKLQLKTPPEESSTAQSSEIIAYLSGDLIQRGGEYGIIGRVGEEITVYGRITRVQHQGRIFRRRLNGQAVEFPEGDDTVDVDAHKDRITDLMASDDAIEQFRKSIAPPLYETPAWETALEWAVAYAFGAPDVHLEDGTVFRGAIHGAIISDYGMGKSLFASALEQVLPDALKRSATSMASDVGLRAAAVEDDFGDGSWTIKPGLLVRANGGHLVLDEIDKADIDLTQINDAIEAPQVVDVEKGGISATYQSKCGVLILGNPEEGRFIDEIQRSEQIDVDPSFLSRMDGIITMRDEEDETRDKAVGDQVTRAWNEAHRVDRGDIDDTDLDELNRPVDTDVMQAWVKYARENIHPVFPDDRLEQISEWYAEEVRQLNGNENADMPVPVTARCSAGRRHWPPAWPVSPPAEAPRHDRTAARHARLRRRPAR